MITNSKNPAFVVSAQDGRVMNELGHTATEKITSEQTGGAYYVFDLVSPPGGGIPPHVHSLEDEIIFVVDGDFEVFLDGKLFPAGPGAVMNFARGTAHAFTNVGTKPGKTRWVVTPGNILPVLLPRTRRSAAWTAGHGQNRRPVRQIRHGRPAAAGLSGLYGFRMRGRNLVPHR